MKHPTGIPSRSLSTVLLAVVLLAGAAHAQHSVEITPDVVYGHKYGMALTMDVYQPKEGNGIGVLFMISGGWYSRWVPTNQAVKMFEPLLVKGFTVFAVRHGSSPKFLLPEIVDDVRRSVRFVRLHAKDIGVDPNRLGVCGASAGGHLSLMLATTSDEGDPKASDPVLRMSDRVAAAVAFYPPTNLQPLVQPGSPYPDQYPALKFDPNQVDDFSPLRHVTADDPPTLLIHGDKDRLVPILHSEKMCEALKDKGVACELLTIEGGGHGFRGDDAKRSSDAWVAWFEKHLVESPAPAAPAADEVKDK